MKDQKSAEQIALEAILLGAQLDGDIQVSVNVRSWHCGYCGTTSASQLAASEHDGQCDQHPMAIKSADAVGAEREACAQQIDDAASREYSRYAYVAASLLRDEADAIRKRGAK